MGAILVSGLINIETTLAVKRFPVEYYPVDYNFFGIESTVSGVGFNVAAALKALGAEPCLWSVVGNDMYNDIVEKELSARKIARELFPLAEQLPQSVVLYDDAGSRRICLDLKNIQDVKYPAESVSSALPDVDFAVLCNINFSRDLIKSFKNKGVCIATDVHVLDRIDDPYNTDFLNAADILFLSNENIAGREREFLDQLIRAYNNQVIVIGLGEQGALMYTRQDGNISRYPALRTREIVNTIGAGDALFSCFIHFYHKTLDPYMSLENAMVFASWKIGEKGAAKGFLSEKELENIKLRAK